MPRSIIMLLAFALVQIDSIAQQLPIPRNIQATYKKGTRSIDGRPGKNYWQNTASYNLRINFNPSTRTVSGTVDISYYNNSPDTLKQIWFKLYPNLYKKGTPHLAGIKSEDLTDGVFIDSIRINNSLADASVYDINGTNMVVNRMNVPSGKTIRFRIVFHYLLNKGSHVRTGEVEPGAAFVAYFFPRIAVYDDIDGWNKNPYLGTQEFYNDFCDF